jgi:hypothetical protein
MATYKIKQLKKTGEWTGYKGSNRVETFGKDGDAEMKANVWLAQVTGKNEIIVPVNAEEETGKTETIKTTKVDYAAIVADGSGYKVVQMNRNVPLENEAPVTQQTEACEETSQVSNDSCEHDCQATRREQPNFFVLYVRAGTAWKDRDRLTICDMHRAQQIALGHSVEVIKTSALDCLFCAFDKTIIDTLMKGPKTNA